MKPCDGCEAVGRLLNEVSDLLRLGRITQSWSMILSAERLLTRAVDAADLHQEETQHGKE